jgi:hypothetical protein
VIGNGRYLGLGCTGKIVDRQPASDDDQPTQAAAATAPAQIPGQIAIEELIISVAHTHSLTRRQAVKYCNLDTGSLKSAFSKTPNTAADKSAQLQTRPV